jgi:hypothetical protein
MRPLGNVMGHGYVDMIWGDVMGIECEYNRDITEKTLK